MREVMRFMIFRCATVWDPESGHGRSTIRDHLLRHTCCALNSCTRQHIRQHSQGEEQDVPLLSAIVQRPI